MKTTPGQGHANVNTRHVNGGLATADSHRDNGKRFVVRADEKLIAFVELESQLALKGMAF
jgi:hypothetical protein